MCAFWHVILPRVDTPPPPPPPPQIGQVKIFHQSFEFKKYLQNLACEMPSSDWLKIRTQNLVNLLLLKSLSGKEDTKLILNFQKKNLKTT